MFFGFFACFRDSLFVCSFVCWSVSLFVGGLVPRPLVSSFGGLFLCLLVCLFARSVLLCSAPVLQVPRASAALVGCAE